MPFSSGFKPALILILRCYELWAKKSGPSLLFQVLVLYTGGTIGMVRNRDGVLVPQPHAMEQKIRSMCTMHDEVGAVSCARFSPDLRISLVAFF